jgi:lysophospholipase L1-like esterase
MLSQIHDPTLPRFASILVATLLVAPGGFAADSPAPASGRARAESDPDGNAVTAPKEACDLLLIGDSLIDTLHGFGGKYAPLEAVWNRMQRHNSGLKAKSTKPQVVLIGDSITHHFGGIPTEGTPPSGQPVWDRLFPQTHPAINLGFGADRIPQVLWRLDHGALDGMAPKRVVLMIGANHVLGDAEPPDAVVDGIRACLQRIRAKTPEAKITLMAVLPCRNPASHPERFKVLRINDGLAALAKEAKVDFLDLGAKFLDAEGNISVALMSDAVHPTLAGYQIWGDTLAPSLP